MNFYCLLVKFTIRLIFFCGHLIKVMLASPLGGMIFLVLRDDEANEDGLWIIFLRKYGTTIRRCFRTGRDWVERWLRSILVE